MRPLGLDGPIDLTTALPPSPSNLQRALVDALNHIALQTRSAANIRRNRPGGAQDDRAIGASWLAGRFGATIDPARLVVTNGTQSALLLLFSHLLSPGGTLMTETLTYAVLRRLATSAGLQVKGLPIDEQGILPDALEAVCRRTTGKRALFCNPTVHNPTTAVAGLARRQEIAAICRKHGVALIEDDVLGLLHPDAPPPIASLAPDVTWYCMSVSKCFAMGLRMAYLIAPTAEAASRLVAPVHRLSWWFPNSLSAMTVGYWIGTGRAADIVGGVREEIADRHAIAGEVLSPIAYTTKPGSLHVWISLPSHLESSALVSAAKRNGVLIRPANLFSVDDAAVPNAVRISLTAPSSREELVVGLSVIAKLIEYVEKEAPPRMVESAMAGLHA